LAPLSFLLIQIPVGGVEVLETLFSTQLESNILLVLLVILPASLIAQPLSSSLTFVALRSLQEKKPIRWPDCFRPVVGKLTPLVVATFLSETVSGMGMLTFFPGVYFTAMYLFIPQLVISEPELPWSVYLLRSKKLAQRTWGKALLTTLVLILLGASSYLGVETGRRPPLWTAGVLWVLLIKVFVSMLAAALVDIWISHYFLLAKSQSGNR
jgi:hypothetical protein